MAFGGSLRRRRKGETPGQDLGRSKGGFSTKIHFRANGHGLPMKVTLSAGQTSDYRGYDALTDSELPAPKVPIADKGYDSNVIRDQVAAQGGTPVETEPHPSRSAPWSMSCATGSSAASPD